MNVLVVGAGPVGATFALLAARAGLTVSLLEARSGPSRETRNLALSHGSYVLLQRAGVDVAALAASEIHRVHTSHRGHFGHAVISREDGGVPALGYVANYANLQAALDTAMATAGIAVAAAAVVTTVGHDGTTLTYSQHGQSHAAGADIIVFADGGANLDKLARLTVSEKDYQQHALLAHIEADRPHHHTAYERFTAEGPAALLPMRAADTAQRADSTYSLVWVAQPERIKALQALDDADFCAAFQAHFGQRAGNFIAVSPRRSYPLRLRTVAQPVAGRAVVVGNAAQALHPVAGQGFNLGLRDAAELVDALVRPAGDADAVLARYATARGRDVARSVGFTDFLVSAFASTSPLAYVPRGLGLAVLDLVPSARRLLARRMLFGAAR